MFRVQPCVTPNTIYFVWSSYSLLLHFVGRRQTRICPPFSFSFSLFALWPCSSTLPPFCLSMDKNTKDAWGSTGVMYKPKPFFFLFLCMVWKRGEWPQGISFKLWLARPLPWEEFPNPTLSFGRNARCHPHSFSRTYMKKYLTMTRTTRWPFPQ